MGDEAFGIPASLREALRGASRVAVLTGAGISAESGIPTFRDAQTGLWSRFRPEDLATPQAFRRDPRLVWEWYAWRHELLAQAQPNAGHLALVELERHVPEVTVITQNVDGLHRRAGSARVIELHGSLDRVRCMKHGHVLEGWPEAGDEVPPPCPECGSPLRPDVVWFGERLPEQAFEEAVEVSMLSEVFLSVGTSGLVEPAASLPRMALKYGAVVALINPEITPLLSESVQHLNGPAGTVLPELLRQTWPEEPSA